MEKRYLMAADPIWVGGVYIEGDGGSDVQGDTFHITFKGGALGTQLTRLTINTDLNTPGFGLGDLFFDTADTGYGADHSVPFQVEKLNSVNSNASVKATVQDGGTLLVLDFTNFVAGDTLTFSIDVDEVQSFDPNETDLAVTNSNFDPITSGVEFQHSKLKAEFTAPHYEDVTGQDQYLNVYDVKFAPGGLQLPADNADGKRDRSAGAIMSLQQVPKPISLAGIVFEDNNQDLIIQPNEARLANVKLELFRLENGNYVSTGHSTTTDAQGNYKFGLELALQPGTYQVRETQPAGYFSVGAKPGRLSGAGVVGKTVTGNLDWLTEITVPLGDQHATELNFGEIRPSSISGTVCVSQGGFTCFDANATKGPLAGVTVQLRDANNQIVATQITANDGTYKFIDLRPGTYSIVEFTPTGLLEGVAQLGSVSGNIANGSEITQIVLNSGITATGYDFCELMPSELSGHAFFDENNNGRRDNGETPLANVLVTLFNEQGQKVAETHSNAQGFYQFLSLPAGTYRITEVTPTDYKPGKAAVGTISGTTTGANDVTGDVLTQIRLPSGRAGIDYNFGELLPGSIAGHVLVDTDGNCIVDAVGDRYLEDVTVQLLDSNGVVIRTTKTDVGGNYRFDDLPIGTYSVREVQPSGLLQAGQRAGSGGGDSSQVDLISQIAVGAGVALVNYDFCEIPPGEISGHVYVDLDQDLVMDAGEVPIAGVTITLLDQNGAVVGTTQTDASGQYKFTGIHPGNYTVREQQPGGYFQGGQKAGSGGGNDTIQDVISAIAIGAGASLVDYDFYEQLPGSISGNVFADLDFDCIQDANEKALESVLVELLDATGNVIATTRTNASGDFEFTNLRPGTYSVRETQPLGYFQGGQLAPATGGDDSVDDVISAIVLKSGMMVTEANFCEVPPATISGYVYQDGPVIKTKDGLAPANIRDVRDGSKTVDDTPIAGVRIQLRFMNGSLVTSDRALPGVYKGPYVEVVTDANGYFEFNGLREAAYHLFESQPVGYIDSIDTPGTTGGVGVNKGDAIPQSILELFSVDDPNTLANFDALLAINVVAGGRSELNNFSELVVAKDPPQTPPLPPKPPEINIKYPEPQLYAPAQLITGQPLIWSPLPLLVGVGHDAPPTWHLSVINGGFPRGRRTGEPLDEVDVAEQADRLDVYAWTVRGMKESTWKIISTYDKSKPTPRPLPLSSRIVFDLPDAQPLAGDFNGDGFDEVALFIDGEWFIDLNGNGRWDEKDIWLKLGTQGDQPVVGDWDGDGKDDAGVFGKKWTGDERALAAEPGLPDPENMRRIKPKNLPPRVDEAPDEPRWLQRSQQGPARADVIDHVFLFGGGRDIAVSGDFNGDGITTIGVFRDGNWTLDIDGDGRLSMLHDRQVEFGQAGDVPIVGDFDGDGIDELAVVRGDQVFVDSNRNGHIDATDQVFQLESDEGTVIVGDFDGDGRDEPALHQPASRARTLEARRAE
ncbi:MAG: SdrD B-like domain-containing protein [Pirellulaceae bacterium]|nr:SdrD B-like domain-containing protein [Pirellulaceae bacterium]